MLKAIRGNILNLLASMIVLVAYVGVSPNSVWLYYEPDVPNPLK